MWGKEYLKVSGKCRNQQIFERCKHHKKRYYFWSSVIHRIVKHFSSVMKKYGANTRKKAPAEKVFCNLQTGKEIWPSKYRHLQCLLAEAVQLFRPARTTTKRILQSIPFYNGRSTKGQGVIWPFRPPPWTLQRGFLSLSTNYLEGYKLC